jgi:pimeloyl-ACP methyl ester carboxylesterase
MVFRSLAREYLLPTGPAPTLTAPTRSGMTGEFGTAIQLVRLAAATPRLRGAPRGDGTPVVLIPGWKAPEASMAPLRAYLRTRGYDARHWGLGVNQGDPEGDAVRVAANVADLAEQTGHPVALVGWSLGGVIARETARETPEHVTQVITYGTPAVGGPSYTIGAHSYGREETQRIARLIDDLDRDQPIRVPITALFTRNDRIVTWGACLDRTSEQVQHVEVRSTHLGMGLDPDVWVTIARRLGGQRFSGSGATT